MENEIKKLIEKYDTYIAEEENVGIKARISGEICRDLECLLKFKQENCCGKVVENETTKNKTE